MRAHLLREIIKQAHHVPHCVVCNKPHPGQWKAAAWVYFADATPMGAMACGSDCAKVAIARHDAGGRVDIALEEERQWIGLEKPG